MPRWRKLHVKTRQSLDINEMPDDFTRLLWVLMPLGLDREGRALDNVSWVKAQLMPLRTDVTLKMVSAALEWYEGKSMIVRYAVNGRAYFHVPTFGHYQGDTTREAESEFPAPPGTDESEEIHEPVTSQSRATQEPVMRESSSDSDTDSNTDSEAEEITAATPPPKPPKRRRKRKTDPRTQHPAIQAVREVTNRYPPKPIWDDIIKLLGDEPRIEEMRVCFKEWVKPGFNPTNFAWLFDWYVSGIPPRKVRYNSVSEKTADVIKRYRERHSGES